MKNKTIQIMKTISLNEPLNFKFTVDHSRVQFYVDKLDSIGFKYEKRSTKSTCQFVVELGDLTTIRISELADLFR
jgi:hypothetical protein